MKKSGGKRVYCSCLFAFLSYLSCTVWSYRYVKWHATNEMCKKGNVFPFVIVIHARFLFYSIQFNSFNNFFSHACITIYHCTRHWMHAFIINSFNVKFGRFFELCIVCIQSSVQNSLSYTLCVIYVHLHQHYCVLSRAHCDVHFINNCANFMTAQSWVQNE